MALDAALAERLWRERYQDQVDREARKNAYLSDFNDPEDLAQDIAVNVWMKAVNKFEPEKVTYTDTTGTQLSEEQRTSNIERAFNSFFSTILYQYLASLSSHRDTGKQKSQRSQVSLDKPVGGDEGETGVTFLDMLESGETGDVDSNTDLQKMLHALPEDLAGPVEYLVQNLTPGNKSEVMKEIRDKWGWTERRLFNALVEEPEFVEFVMNAD